MGDLQRTFSRPAIWEIKGEIGSCGKPGGDIRISNGMSGGITWSQTYTKTTLIRARKVPSRSNFDERHLG